MEKNEFLILSQLRQNARKNLTKISRTTGIPVSTIFDKLKVYEKNIINKHTSLLNYSKLGYDVWVKLILKVKSQEMDNIENFLMKSDKVNSFYRINNGFDFMVEAIFKGVRDYYIFSEKLNQFGIKKKNEFFVLQDMKREAFLDDLNIMEQIS